MVRNTITLRQKIFRRGRAGVLLRTATPETGLGPQVCGIRQCAANQPSS